MRWDQREKEELRLDEGLRLKAYKDTAVPPVLTIGYGSTKGVSEGDVITLEQAEELLNDDFEEAVKTARKICDCFDGLDGPRKGVIVNMAFNLGNRLSTFHNFLRLVDDAHYKEAAEHMLVSLWAKQVKSRAKRLAYRMATSEYSLRT